MPSKKFNLLELYKRLSVSSDERRKKTSFLFPVRYVCCASLRLFIIILLLSCQTSKIYPLNLGVTYCALKGSVWNDKKVSLLWLFNAIAIGQHIIIRSIPFLFIMCSKSKESSIE